MHRDSAQSLFNLHARDILQLNIPRAVIEEPLSDPQLTQGESILDLRSQEELSLYFQISDFLTQ